METRNVRVPIGKYFACGEVNSRNGFGGMTGFKPFVAGASTSMPVVIQGEEISDGEFTKLWNSACL